MRGVHPKYPEASQWNQAQNRGRWTSFLGIQYYMKTLHTNVMELLGRVVGALGGQIHFQVSCLVPILIDAICHGVQHAPEDRLGPILTGFCLPFITACPSDLYDVSAIPLLTSLLPLMLQRLSASWQSIDAADDEMEEEEDFQVSFLLICFLFASPPKEKMYF